MNLPSPTDEQAMQFAVMLKAGLPAEQAILYFLSDDDPLLVGRTLAGWLKSKAVAKAQRLLQGKSWEEMTDEEMLQAAIAQHYRGLAYLLVSTNYITASPAEKAKMDSARTAIEAKLAGTAGKLDALSSFYEDIRKGRVMLPQVKAS